MGTTNAETSMAHEPAAPRIPDSAIVAPMPYENRLCGEGALLAIGQNFFAIKCENYTLVHKQEGNACTEELWYQSPHDAYIDVMRDTNCDGIAEEFLVTDANGNNMHPENPEIVRYEFPLRTADMDLPEAKAVWHAWLEDQEFY